MMEKTAFLSSISLLFRKFVLRYGFTRNLTTETTPLVAHHWKESKKRVDERDDPMTWDNEDVRKCEKPSSSSRYSLASRWYNSQLLGAEAKDWQARHTVVPNIKNPPKIRLKNSWNWRVILLPATIWQILNMKCREWPETETVWMCRKTSMKKIREITSNYVWKPMCGSKVAATAAVARYIFTPYIRLNRQRGDAGAAASSLTTSN